MERHEEEKAYNTIFFDAWNTLKRNMLPSTEKPTENPCMDSFSVTLRVNYNPKPKFVAIRPATRDATGSAVII